MREIVRQKLDAVFSLYTEERMRASKARWQAVWKGQRPDGRYPFSFGFPVFNPYNINHPAQERLMAYLDAFALLGRADDDLLPVLFPGLNHATLPSMFGAKEIRCGLETTSEQLVFVPEDIDALPAPAILPGSPAQGWLDVERYFREETEGLLSINICDMQGPVDAAAQLFSYDGLFLLALEEPQRYGALMDKMTDAFLMLYERQKTVVGAELFSGTHLFAWDWYPPENGAALSMDSLVMMSPSFYEGLVKPYIECIAERFGGVTVHSCGDFRHLVPNLCATRGLKAINASQLTARQLYEAGLDKGTALVAMIGCDDLEENMQVIREHGLNACLTVMGVWPGEDVLAAGITAEDWDAFHQKQRRVHAIMRQ
jgi:hypothetical protein